MKKILLILLIGAAVHHVAWAKNASIKLPEGVRNGIADDCVSDALNAFLHADNQPALSLGNFQLNEVTCSSDGARLVYQKSENTLSMTIRVNQSGGGLAERLVKMQRAVIKTYESHIQAFDELQKKLPEVAASQEKREPPPGKYLLPTGDTLYFRRQICDDACDSVQANAMLSGERYFFEVVAENNDASRSQQAAEKFVQSVTDSVQWARLR
ncbi:hypothetical protein [Edaphovirga cremea]|uniref:hypothetical protein n=1 Tax=Edaphovirga cremea TaxID=2267246 RepID=UPI0039896CB3